jgi:hypothetical protein
VQRWKAVKWASTDIKFLVYDDTDVKSNGYDSDDTDGISTSVVETSRSKNDGHKATNRSRFSGQSSALMIITKYIRAALARRIRDSLARGDLAIPNLSNSCMTSPENASASVMLQCRIVGLSISSSYYHARARSEGSMGLSDVVQLLGTRMVFARSGHIESVFPSTRMTALKLTKMSKSMVYRQWVIATAELWSLLECSIRGSHRRTNPHAMLSSIKLSYRALVASPDVELDQAALILRRETDPRLG